MKLRRPPLRWSVSVEQAERLQLKLAADVIVEPYGGSPRFVAGVDAAVLADGSACVGGVAVWDAVAARIVETHTSRRRVVFPYVSGLLSFREAPAVLAALRKVRAPVQVLLCDGHGQAHPRRFGLACHVGLIADLPSVGCAPRVLAGAHGTLGESLGSSAALRDDGQEIGRLLRTKAGSAGMVVSVGHRVDLASAERIVLGCVGRHRRPEPTRQARRLVDSIVARSRGAG